MTLKLSCRLFFSAALVTLFSAGAEQAWATPAPTTTTLTITSGGTAVTSAASGSEVILTAAVVSGSTKVTTGQVNFCDATAPSCSDIHFFGNAQITGAGTAVLSLRPAIGTHSYKAVFAGTPRAATAYAASVSGTATLSVAGLYPAFAVLTYTDPSSPAYDLTAVVGGNASAAPAGTVSFLDVNNNAALGTASLSALPPGPNLLNVDWPVFAWFALDSIDVPEPIAVGDFNGDGSPDIAGAGSAGCNVGPCWDAAAGTVLNDGTGHLNPAAVLDLGTSLQTVYVAVGDFNGDGKLDLAVGGYAGQSYSITILLGNGDGTFTNKGSVATGGAFQAFAVGDFNGDGISDLAVANTTAGIVTILLGNGDGTFTPSTAATSPTGDNPVTISVADFNGDGIPDLAIGNDPQGGSTGSLTILLGNGDGTFTTAASPATTSGVNSIAVADFNGDGKPDIAVANGLTLTMLKGNGDGTFASSTITPTAGFFVSSAMVLGDFNGDGKADLAFAGHEFLLLGNGDGTFTTAPFNAILATSVGSATFQIAAGADFNGDGTTDLTGPASDAGEVESIGTVLLASNWTASGTATGVTLPPATGFQEVDASYPGDSSYEAVTSGIANLSAPLGSAMVSLTASPNPAFAGLPVTLAATVTGIGVAPAGTVQFYDGSVLVGLATLNSSGVATFATTTLPIGPNSLTASYAGGGYYNVANSAAVVETVAAAGTAVPTVTVTPAATSISSAQIDTVAVSVTAATGGPTPSGSVTLSSGSYTAQQPLVSGAASFTIPAGALASGANTLTAAYSGDATYAAESATATVTVAQVSMAIPAPTAVPAGTSATATVALTAGSSYSGTLNLACALTKSPTGAVGLPTCSLNPASVSLKSSGGATSVLTLSTTASSSASLANPSRKNLWGFGGGSAVLAVLFLCGIPARRRRFASLLTLLCLVFASLAIGCGGGGSRGNNLGPATPGTTSGAYIFTVTGTDSASAAITTSTTVTLTVQ
jgi:Bacterial Ig-like domain (group 3)/FG-GAP-like repeat